MLSSIYRYVRLLIVQDSIQYHACATQQTVFLHGDFFEGEFLDRCGKTLTFWVLNRCTGIQVVWCARPLLWQVNVQGY